MKILVVALALLLGGCCELSTESCIPLVLLPHHDEPKDGGP